MNPVVYQKEVKRSDIQSFLLPFLTWLLLIGFLAVVAFPARSQTYQTHTTQKRVGYRQLAHEIFIEHKDVEYEGVFFYNDLPDGGKESFTTTYNVPPSPVVIEGGFKSWLGLNKVQPNAAGLFETGEVVLLRNCVFESDLRFHKVQFNLLSLNGCTFPTPSPDAAGLSGTGGALFLDSCIVLGGFGITNQSIEKERFFPNLLHSEFGKILIALTHSSLKIERCKAKEVDINLSNHSFLTCDSNVFNLINRKDAGRISVEGDLANLLHSTFSGEDSSSLYLDVAEGTQLHLLDNTFKVCTHFESSTGSMILSGNTFENQLTLDFSSQLEYKSWLDLESVKNLKFGIELENGFNDGSQVELSLSEGPFTQYVRQYKLFYDFFKLTGDFNSANKTYIRIRDVEKMRFQHHFNANPTFRNFFNLALSKLLSYYTRYGTDPARALLISFYMVLGFAVLYFFFPSDWDIASKPKLIRDFRTFIEKNERGYLKPFFSMLFGLVISLANAFTLGQRKNLGIELKIGIALRLKRSDAGYLTKPVFSEGIDGAF